MLVGARLRELRRSKKLTQADIHERTGLLSCYISRVENGHTVPSIETLQKLAGALRIPLYQIFYIEESPERPKVPQARNDKLWGCSRRDARNLNRFCGFFSQMEEPFQDFLMSVAARMSRRRAENKNSHSPNGSKTDGH